MKISPEIEAAAAWLRAQADQVKSCSAVDVPPAETAFAALRLRACADGLLAGLHMPEPAEAAHD
ncbi:hypothetical protein O4H52_01000 [Sphingomonadaceae bacterium G21617-S1]|nr:hypothetical protein [Sphingomonadaceae bacterium G21617-S1]